MGKVFLVLLLLTSSTLWADDLDVDQELKDLQKHADEAVKKVEQAQKLLNPAGALQGKLPGQIAKLAGNPKFQKALERVWAHPDRSKVFVYQGTFLVGYWLAKFLLFLLVRGFFWRLLLRLPLLLLFWSVNLYFIPVWVLGNSYKNLVDIIRQHFGY